MVATITAADRHAMTSPRARRRATRSIVRFDDVVLRSSDSRETSAVTGSLQLAPGELLLLMMPSTQASTIADACAGLLVPESGTVFFSGKDWQERSGHAIDAARGQIGRVFSKGHWLANITVAENIMLPSLHHTKRTRDSVINEALGLSLAFSLPGIPHGLPDTFSQSDLQRAACVRAFMGTPSLVILEQPTTGIYPDVLHPLVNCIRAARDRGAGVLWLTEEDEVWRNRSIPVSRYFRLAGRELLEVKISQ